MTVIEATIVDLEHGTPQAYRRCTVDDGRACGPCRRANAAGEAKRRKSPAGYVAAGKVRTHILVLHDDGMSYREIGRRARVDARTVQRIAVGEIDSCTPASRAAILSVLPSFGPGCGTNHKPVTTAEGFDPADIDDGAVELVFDDPLASLRLLLTDAGELDWKADGECARLDITVERRQQWFFPMRGESTAPAVTICGRCPVWAPCLQFALDWNMEGVWGRSAGSHRRKLVHLAITVDELVAVGMDDDPDLTVGDAIGRVVESRQAVA